MFSSSESAGFKTIGCTRAVFPTVARINHSCVPNAQGNFNAILEGGSFTIHALRDIEGGDELTISYLHDELALRQERQIKLKDLYGFRCECEICCAGQRGQRSQERRERLRTDLGQLVTHKEGEPSSEEGVATRGGDAEKTRTTTESTESHKLIHLVIAAYEQDGLAGRELASLYATAAGIAVREGNIGEASRLGARSLELERDAVGNDSPFYEAQRLELGEIKFADPKEKRNRRIWVKEPVEENELSYAPWS